jgi:hypothetical protein
MLGAAILGTIIGDIVILVIVALLAKLLAPLLLQRAAGGKSHESPTGRVSWLPGTADTDVAGRDADSGQREPSPNPSGTGADPYAEAGSAYNAATSIRTDQLPGVSGPQAADAAAHHVAEPPRGGRLPRPRARDGRQHRK